MGITNSSPWKYVFGDGKTKSNIKKDCNCHCVKLSTKQKVSAAISSSKSPENNNIRLFELNGEGNTFGNIDFRGASINIGLKHQYKPATDPIKGIKKHMKNETTLKENIKKAALVFKLIPKLKADSQLRSLFKNLPYNHVAMSAYIISLQRGESKINKAAFIIVNKYISKISFSGFDKLAIMRFRRHCKALNINGVFSLQFLFGSWQQMDTLEIICFECAIGFCDSALLITQELGLNGKQVIQLKEKDIKEMAQALKYDERGSKQVCELVQCMRKKVLHESYGDHVHQPSVDLC